MHVINSDDLTMFDVDETLIFWKVRPEDTAKGVVVRIEEPYIDGVAKDVVPNNSMIDILKRKKAQGKTIIVWSFGGYKWAERVVKALGLESFVDYAMSKPVCYGDDIPIEKWGLHRIYVSDRGSQDKR